MDTTTTATATTPHLLLVPGFWLGGWAWEEVLDALREHPVTAEAVTLPGLHPGDTPGSVTPEQQADALEAAVHRVPDGRPVVLVLHSGANVAGTVVLDRAPSAVSRVVYVDSGPVADGAANDDTLPSDLAELVLPAFDELPASLDGLDEEALARFRDRALPQPGRVVTQPLRLTDLARRDVPTTIICCSFPSEALLQMARSGDPMMAETATLTDLDLVDLPTGHWPMWSRPADLAAALATASLPR